MHFGGGGWSARLCPQLLSSNVVNDLLLLESLLDNLTARQKDTSARVRRLVLRGLANVASGSPEKVSRWVDPAGMGAEVVLRGWAAGRGLGTQVCVVSPGTDPQPPTPDSHDQWAG